MLHTLQGWSRDSLWLTDGSQKSTYALLRTYAFRKSGDRTYTPYRSAATEFYNQCDYSDSDSLWVPEFLTLDVMGA
jgi:hypothetical protein